MTHQPVENPTSETIPFGDWIVPPEALADARSSRIRYRKPLKIRPQYGVFLWWPSTDGWVHPDDRETTEQFVPGQRVLRREQVDGFSDQQLGFVAYHYGEISFRAMPIMWLEVDSEGFQPGDFVELKSQHGKTRPLIARIQDVLWDRRANRIRYRVTTREMPIKRLFDSSDLRPAIPLEGHLSLRHLQMAAQENAV